MRFRLSIVCAAILAGLSIRTASAAFYSVTLLHPAGFQSSEAVSVSGNSQGGFGHDPLTDGFRHALLWSGTAAS